VNSLDGMNALDGMSRFVDKVALVTGGASGIGLAAVRRFLQEGAAVVLADVDAARGAAAAAALSQEGLTRVTPMAADVSLSADVRRLVDETLARHEHIDALFNNAGFFEPGEVHEVAEEDWDRQLAVNLKSVYLVSAAVVPCMLKQGGGAIVNNASVAALVGDTKSAAYCASKSGIAGLTRAMALDYAKRGIRVNAICCGEIDTPLFERESGQLGTTVDEYRAVLNECHPIGRIGTPAEVAAAVAFLASDDAAFVTGVLLPVDGGYSAL